LLELTQNTIETVNDLSEASDAGGLRIFRHRAEDEFVLSAALVDGPTEGDEIVEVDGASVFLDAAAADVLADKRLDVRVSGGRVQLSLADQS
jgi:iron-sulfur cluster assembly protein